MLTFTHAGRIEDFIYSLYFCKELMELNGDAQFNIHLQTNVIYRDSNKIGFTRKQINFLLPLLQKQSYINNITFSNIVPSNSIDLNKINTFDLNIHYSEIRGWYYNLVANHLPREFWKPVIFVEPNYKFKDKIIFSWTQEYANYQINFNVMNQFKNDLIFFGSVKEYEQFTKKYFKIPYFRYNNLLEAAQYIAGAKGFVGTRGDLFPLTECMKTPRIMISPQFLETEKKGTLCEGPNNNNLFGGWNEVAVVDEKLVSSIKEMLKIS